MTPTIAWVGDAETAAIRILDQTRLPEEEVYLELREIPPLCEAIAPLRIRGAPAIGIAGAYGVALAAQRAVGSEAGDEQIRAAVARAAEQLRAARPTAVNLAWGVDRIVERFAAAWGSERGVTAARRAAAAALAGARAVHEEDLAMSRAMGAAGARLVPEGGRIITHCNTGGLATGGLGTALAVAFRAQEEGKAPRVFVDETRPLLQGARLTTWELLRAGIAATLIVDGAAAWRMATGGADLVLVGADRVAANGDAANKIGTYALAIVAARHGVPFYVVAPSSTFDLECPRGSEIVIEARPAEEVRSFRGRAAAPPEVEVWNPAFDVTPAELIAGWVTEGGVRRPPFSELAG